MFTLKRREEIARKGTSNYQWHEKSEDSWLLCAQCAALPRPSVLPQLSVLVSPPICKPSHRPTSLPSKQTARHCPEIGAASESVCTKQSVLKYRVQSCSACDVTRMSQTVKMKQNLQIPAPHRELVGEFYRNPLLILGALRALPAPAVVIISTFYASALAANDTFSVSQNLRQILYENFRTIIRDNKSKENCLHRSLHTRNSPSITSHAVGV